MVLVVCGLLIGALGVARFRQGAISADSVAVDGVVAELSTFRSATRTGKKLYAPIVEFRDPMSGAQATVEAQTHTNNRPEVGSAITVMYDPLTGTAIIPQSLFRRMGLIIIGLACAGLGVLSMAGVV